MKNLSTNLFQYLCNFEDVNIEDIVKLTAFHGTIGEYQSLQGLFSIYQSIQEENWYLAWSKELEYMKELRGNSKLLREDNPESLGKMAALLLKNAECLRLNITQKDNEEWLNELKQISLLTEDEKLNLELVKVFPRRICDRVKKMFINKGLLSIHRYRGDGKLPVDQNVETVISKNFVMTDNTYELLNNMQFKNDNKLHIYVTLCIEEILSFSYFLIVFKYNENCWIATDQPEFANFEAMKGIGNRNGGYRYRENIFDNTLFPYCCLDIIEEKRKTSASLQTGNENITEMYNTSIMEWSTFHRISLHYIIKECIRNISYEQYNDNKLTFIGDHIKDNTLLLEDKSVSLEETMNNGNFDCEEWNTEIRKVIKNLIYPHNSETNIVKVNTTNLLSTMAKHKNLLVTEEKFLAMKNSSLLQEEFVRRSQLLNVNREQLDNDINRFTEMVKNNFSNIAGDIIETPITYIYIYDAEATFDNSRTVGGGISHKTHKILTRLVVDNNNGWNRFPPISNYEGEKCQICHGRTIKKSGLYKLNITHYATLAWLAGMRREDLPFSVANYMSELFWPYCGNHLLSNINPLYRLRDRLSQEKQSYLSLKAAICPICCRRYQKQNTYEEAVIVIDRKTCRKIEKLEKSAFLEKYNKEECVITYM